MSYPLLDYMINTNPLPLRSSQKGEITIVAQVYKKGTGSEPTQPINIQKIQFTFGNNGSGDGADQLVSTPPVGNGPAITSSLNGALNWSAASQGVIWTIQADSDYLIGEEESLTFNFPNIDINQATGEVAVTILETTNGVLKTEQTLHVYKFPADDSQTLKFWSNVDAIPYGTSPKLSWSGGAGTYSLTYKDETEKLQTITSHHDGTLLQPNDSYPKDQNDPLLLIKTDTWFHLAYTPTDGGNAQKITDECQIFVTYPDLKIAQFDISPQDVLHSAAPLPVTFNWSVNHPDLISSPELNGAPISYDKSGSSSADLTELPKDMREFSANQTFEFKIANKYAPQQAASASKTLSFWNPVSVTSFKVNSLVYPYGENRKLTYLGKTGELDVYRVNTKSISSGYLSMSFNWEASGDIKHFELSSNVSFAKSPSDYAYYSLPTPSATDRSCSISASPSSGSYLYYAPEGSGTSDWYFYLKVVPHAGNPASMAIKIIPSNQPFP